MRAGRPRSQQTHDFTHRKTGRPKKGIHPDLSVLYVYGPEGRLVYQKTEIMRGHIMNQVLAVLPRDDGTERLLVGSEAKDGNALVLEYAAAR